ncbi:MAG TPA: M15 family metallopeptidase [Actinomycetota bacterium]
MTRRSFVLLLLGATLAGGCSIAGPRGAPPPPPSAQDVPVVDPAMPPSPGASPMTEPEPAEPRFEGEVRRIGPGLRSKIVGRSWHPGCPVALGDLRHVRVSYWDFEGDVRTGPLIVHEREAEDILWVFRRLFRARFPIKHLVLPPKWRPPRPSDYWDRTPSSPTAAFNCRPAVGSTVWSEHAYGLAIDINPLQNPYVRSDGSTLRHIARPYRDRSRDRKGMIHDGDVVVRSFAAIGWEWGGHWRTLKDYMHFSLTER